MTDAKDVRFGQCHCGIYTHHQRRANPNQYAVNVACPDGVSPFNFEEVPSRTVFIIRATVTALPG